MSFDFPNAPSEGTTFAPTGGPVYVYTGGVWRMQGSGQVVTAEARNRVVNPAMQISQEWGNTLLGPSTALATYVTDQWQGVSSTSPGQVSQQRVQVVTPNGSQNRIRMIVTTAKAALAAGDYLSLYQPVEGIRVADFRWGTANAKQVVLRFGFKGPAGTYTASIRNGVATRTYPVNFTISAGQANLDTEQVFVIPGDTAGTWVTDTASGLIVTINLAAGTSSQGVAGVWQAGNFTSTAAASNGLATLNNTFELFDVGLYLDPNATGTPPPWQMPDEAQELAACQRYFYAQVGSGWIPPYYNNFVGRGISARHPVVMRIAPAMTGTGAAAAGGTYGISASVEMVSYAATLNQPADGVSFSNIKANARM